MAYDPAAAELFTVVENLTNGERQFGYLGPRGMRLAAGEAVAVRGNLISTLGGKTSARKFQALERSLKNNTLRIRSTPAPVIWDPVTEQAHNLAIHNGVLGMVDPTYRADSSSDFDPI